ncbi:unnamed protein product [Owenia fusiformis]|uniref:Uncharacterized protein n=1 Tax=Owenia fusiformis TaxID=6347 RepID=A0A8J1U4T9_OWEFU|nr:unnamed protein product [Owenia fusiformis]
MNDQVILALFLVLGSVAAQWSLPPSTSSVATGQPTQQSSNNYAYNNGFSFLAVDGNEDTNFYHGSCTQTRAQRNPWWMVDLRQAYTIYSVKLVSTVFPRNTLENFRIEASNDTLTWDSCRSHSGRMVSTWQLFYCTRNLIGRYVRIQRQDYNQLTLCEVAVNVQT